MSRFLPLLFPAALLLLSCGDKEEPDEDEEEADADTDTDTDDTGLETFEDEDHDGYTSDVDCDDNDGTAYPDAVELCDGVDNDCDEEIDEDFDLDGDGHFDEGRCEDGDDCDDEDATIYGGAEDIPYDEIDQDCDGEDLVDADSDGFIGEEAGGNDCDDTDPSVNPGATEVAKDGIDQDCSGSDSYDGDGDGYEDDAYGGDDCDDEDTAVNPGAWEWSNDGIDADCDGDDDAVERDPGSASIVVDMDATATAYLGNSVLVCDLDDDGIDDLVMAAPFADTYAGGVWIFYGANLGTWSAGMDIGDADASIVTNYSFLGFDLDCGDIDGDGYTDLSVLRGTFFYDDITYASLSNTYGLHIWYGDGSALAGEVIDSDSDALLTYDFGLTSSTTVFSPQVSLGDLDGDGTHDILFDMNPIEGAEYESSEVWIVPGSSWSGESDLSDHDRVVLTNDSEASVTEVAVVEDLDGDGSPDLLLGQAVYSSDEGETYPGRLSFLSSIPGTNGTIEDLAFADLEGWDDAYFGYRSTLADLDGDGAPDLLVGAPTHDESDGTVLAYLDAASLLSTTGIDGSVTDSNLLATADEAELGLRVLNVGDIDQDGSEDVLVMEPYGGSDAYGRLRLLGGGLVAAAGTENVEDTEILLWAPEITYSTDLLGYALGSGDFDGDGVPDLVMGARGYNSGSGRVYVELSSETWAP